MRCVSGARSVASSEVVCHATRIAAGRLLELHLVFGELATGRIPREAIERRAFAICRLCSLESLPPMSWMVSTITGYCSSPNRLRAFSSGARAEVS